MLLKITIDIDQQSKRWQPADIRAVKRGIRATLNHQLKKIDQKIVISLVLTTDKKIQKLNAEWRGKNKPTNILSFPSGALENISDYPRELPLGDLVLAYETCNTEAQKMAIKLPRHLTHLAAHGCLHLLGYDHETDADHRQMLRVELQILTELGLANPYPLMEQ